MINYDEKYTFLMFSFYSRGNGGNLGMRKVKDFKRAEIIVGFDGTIQLINSANNIKGINTDPFIVEDKNTRNVQVHKVINGKLRSIDVHAVIRYAFRDDCKKIKKYEEYKEKAKKMYLDIKEDIKPNWKLI